MRRYDRICGTSAIRESESELDSVQMRGVMLPRSPLSSTWPRTGSPSLDKIIAAWALAHRVAVFLRPRRPDNVCAAKSDLGVAKAQGLLDEVATP